MGLSAIKALPHYKLVLVNQLTRQGKKNECIVDNKGVAMDRERKNLFNNIGGRKIIFKVSS
jgi:flagellar biosynthesis/type III secretory pathway chaperone